MKRVAKHTESICKFDLVLFGPSYYVLLNESKYAEILLEIVFTSYRDPIDALNDYGAQFNRYPTKVVLG
jgi:hypothetical protein